MTTPSGVLKSLSLEGTAVIITGGGTGLGKEMALALARAGADVIVAGRRIQPIEDTSATIRALGRQSMAVSTDVTDSSSVRNLVARTMQLLGKVDVLVNNAGLVRGQGGVPIWDVTDEMWREGIDANLTGAFYCARAVARYMVERGRGKIINVSSGYGLRGARDNYMYASAKGGIIQLTRSLAVSLGRYGVTSNAIVPGFFPTEGTTVSTMELPSGEFIPVGRTGFPPELGPVVVWLASPASDYMTGEMFVVDGGGLAGGAGPTGYAPVVRWGG
ncbi:MAG: SDR family oxidoreductase [Chloroflexi bacterium]|nr:SDR family oxidoreductase [Chloroflexota bacterium]